MLVVLFPLIVVGLVVVWAFVARVLHKASIASLLITILFPVAVLVFGYDRLGSGRRRWLALLVLVRHAANIRRLLRREENDLGVRPHRLRRRCPMTPEEEPMARVRKAVIPAAGLGTRFLPATKSQPKEMLPVVDKPAIQYVVEEAVKAGLTDILIITGRNKRAIEDHFDRNFELEHFLEQAGKHDLLKEVQFASELADIHYVRQRDPLGLGHAVSVAREHVGDEPFAVLLADDIMVDDGELLRSMLDVHERYGRSCIALTEVTPEEISSYGCVEPLPSNSVVRRRRQPGRWRRRDAAIVEKPPPDEAPSNLAVFGRYVFTPEIFDALDRIEPGPGRRAAAHRRDRAAARGAERVRRACSGDGRYDIGQKLDFLRANVELALDRADLGPAFGDVAARRDRTSAGRVSGPVDARGVIRVRRDPARRGAGRRSSTRSRVLAPRAVRVGATRAASCSRPTWSRPRPCRRSRTPAWTATRCARGRHAAERLHCGRRRAAGRARRRRSRSGRARRSAS